MKLSHNVLAGCLATVIALGVTASAGFAQTKAAKPSPKPSPTAAPKVAKKAAPKMAAKPAPKTNKTTPKLAKAVKPAPKKVAPVKGTAPAGKMETPPKHHS